MPERLHHPVILLARAEVEVVIPGNELCQALERRPPRHRGGQKPALVQVLDVLAGRERHRRVLHRAGEAVLLLLASRVWASDPEGIFPAASVTHVRGGLDGRVTAEEQPFAFVVDPSTPCKGVVAVGYTIGMSSGISADRPIPVVLQNQGVANNFSLGYGVTSWFEPTLNVNVNSNLSSNATTADAILGLKFQLTNPDSPWRASVRGAWVRGLGSFGAGPLLVEANLYVEHVFETGRDALDYIGMLGASYRVLPFMRVGAEYVGQDLEEVFEPGAEGGARMGMGPDVALDLDRGRFQIVVAALFGLNSASPTAMLRAGVLGSF